MQYWSAHCSKNKPSDVGVICGKSVIFNVLDGRKSFDPVAVYKPVGLA